MSTNRQRRSALVKASSPNPISSRREKIDNSYWSERYRKKKEAGICQHCSSPATVGGLCLVDWFKNVASVHFGTRKLGQELSDLWAAQNGICAYSGEVLTPGLNASLDHKIPITRGGHISIQNVQWVSKRVNTMKTDLTDTEFITLCDLIASRRKGV
jgi:hypothetical protein